MSVDFRDSADESPSNVVATTGSALSCDVVELDAREPLISVVVPAYGVERYLFQCVGSVVGQTYERLDIVLVDDGSPDGCGAICDDMVSRDGRVRVVHTENHGLAAARNLCVSFARGEYVLFLDGDDWLEPRAIDVLVDVALRTGADMVCSRAVSEWKTGASGRNFGGEPLVLMGDDVLRGLIVGGLMGIAAWGKLYRKSLFDSVRYPEGHVYEDAATTYRLCQASGVAVCMPDVLVHYRMRRGSICRSRSASVIVDYWWAQERCYRELRGISAEVHAACVRRCLNAIARTWCWWSLCPAEERRAFRTEITDMKDFARRHVREVLLGDYTLRTKASCVLGCWASPVVWVPMHALNTMRRRYLDRRGMFE